MRDWLTVIIVLLIVGILLDAFRRMRQARRESLQLSKNAQKADMDDVSVSSSEFPSGGARVAGYRDPKDVSSVNQTLKKSYLAKKTTVGAPNRIPEQVTLNLDEHVPMLMDSVDNLAAQQGDEDAFDPHMEPSLGSLDELDADDILRSNERDIPVGSEESTTEKTDSRTEPKKDSRKESGKVSGKSSGKASRSEPSTEPEYRQPDEVLIINVMAHSGTRFSGEELLQSLMEQSMKLGAMDIFHRHLSDDGDGPILFSLANMVVPGTFNLAQMKEFQTPGVSLFLSLPLELDGALDEQDYDGLCIRAYDKMAATARALAATLDGELKDENRSVMTLQTIEHGRQRVVEYERKQKLARA